MCLRPNTRVEPCAEARRCLQRKKNSIQLYQCQNGSLMRSAYLASGQVCLTTGSGCQVCSNDEKAGLPSSKYLHMSLEPPTSSTRFHMALDLLSRV